VHLKAIRDREEERPEISAGEQLGIKKAMTLGETGKPEANTTSSDQSDNGHDSKPGSTSKPMSTKRANTIQESKGGKSLVECNTLHQVLAFIAEQSDAANFFRENDLSNKDLFEKLRQDRSMRDLHIAVHHFIS
jgi:hypothetical protein